MKITISQPQGIHPASAHHIGSGVFIVNIQGKTIHASLRSNHRGDQSPLWDNPHLIDEYIIPIADDLCVVAAAVARTKPEHVNITITF